MSRKPGGKHRTADQVARDRAEIAVLYCQGWTQARIGQKLGLSQPAVFADLEVVRQEWRASAVMAMDQRKSQELAKLDRVEAVAWEAWERSCQQAETLFAETIKGRVDKEGKPLPELQKTSKTLKGQVGDPRFLERVGWCIERRCKILGMDAPERNENRTVVTVDERRGQLLGIIDSLRQRAGTN